MSSTSTVALLGATGFIGRRMARLLGAHGHQVRALVRPGSPRRSDPIPGNPEIRECRANLGDARLRDALRGVDAVIYAAGAVRGIDDDDFVDANVRGVEAVAGMLDSAPPPRPALLLISSLAARHPRLSPYARSKRGGERILADHPGIDATIFRPPAVYGPGDRDMRPLFDWMRRGLAIRTGPRGQRLSLLHVDDLAAAAAAWLETPGAMRCGGVFELHDGRIGGYRFDELLAEVNPGPVVRLPVPGPALWVAAHANAALSRLRGRAPMLTPGKFRELRHPSWCCHDDDFERLGWRPAIALSRGIAELYARPAPAPRAIEPRSPSPE